MGWRLSLPPPAGVAPKGCTLVFLVGVVTVCAGVGTVGGTHGEGSSRAMEQVQKKTNSAKDSVWTSSVARPAPLLFVTAAQPCEDFVGTMQRKWRW